MTTTNYHVAIIGGGVAGLTLAIQLADAGYSCIVFEKNKYPFHKVCGEYVSKESKAFLERLGLNLSAYHLPEINRLHVSSPSGTLLKHKLDLGGIGISRYLLDHALYQLAKQKGVVVLEECKVQQCSYAENGFSIQTAQGNYTAELCAGAWGKQSNMDSSLKRKFTTGIKKKEKNYVGIKYHVKLSFPDDLIELHNFKNGYCGISKIENETCCICYLTAAENLKKYNGNIKQMEEEIIKENPILKTYFESAQFLFDEPLAISQVRIGYKSAVEQQVFLLGDAAGNMAPLSGNGMSMAMRSSLALYSFMNDYFNRRITREELNSRYEKFWKKQFKRRIQISAGLQSLLKNKTLTNVTITILKGIPFLRNAVVRSTHGKPF